MSYYFLSDIHLKPHGDPKAEALSGYLKHIETEGAKKVFFLGDIFDFWMGGHQFWVNRYKSFVDAVESLRKSGADVYFFEGNHDIHIDPFFEKQLGVKVFTEPQILELYGLKVRIEHGDLFNPDDKNYLLLRKLLRSSALRAASLLAPGAFVGAIGDWGSATSGKRSKREGRRPEVIADIKRRTREYVKKCASETDFDLMIMGHTHVQEDYEIMNKGRSVRYVNLGSWFDKEPHVFILHPDSQGYEKIIF